ncbi:MAG: DMT family transporter [Mogibacterium sp.]|nr:DMT family transporter [Mogibacterium sp.]
MIYLIFAVISSALIAIVMRISEGRTSNNISALAVNYVACLILGLIYTISSSGKGGVIVPLSDGSRTIALGLINGIFYVSSFLTYQYNIHKNGVVMPSTFMKLGVIVPTLSAIVIFGEQPGIMQIAGIILAVFAIIFMNTGGSTSEKSNITAPKALILLLFVGGLGDTMSKVYEETGKAEYNSQFLLYTFTMALILCSITAVIKGQKLTFTDVLAGLCIGVPNYYSARFVLLSLSHLPAIVVYPTYSVCTILVVAAAGVFFFHEKMTGRQWLAIGLIITALILLKI